MARLKNPSKKQQVGMLDRRWSAYIRSLGRCENCGTANELTCSHIVGRTYIKTRFDPRNLQALCFSCHGKMESQPIAFARWVETTSCGKYVDTMLVQANNAVAKPDYNLWMTLHEEITKRGFTVEQSRQWLGDQILFSEYDLLLLD